MTATAATMAALQAKGIETRRARTALKAEVRKGRTRFECCDRLAAILEDQPAHLDRIMVWETLTWARLLSDEHRRLLLHHAGIYDDFRTFEQLSARQRNALAAALRSVTATGRNPC